MSAAIRTHDAPTTNLVDYFTFDYEGSGQQLDLHDPLELGATHFRIRLIPESERARFGGHRYLVQATRPGTEIVGEDILLNFCQKDEKTGAPYVRMEPRCLQEFFLKIFNNKENTEEENARLTREHQIGMKKLFGRVHEKGVSLQRGMSHFVHWARALDARVKKEGSQGLAGWSDTSHYDPVLLNNGLKEAGVTSLVYLFGEFRPIENASTAIKMYSGQRPEDGIWKKKGVQIPVPEGVEATHNALEDARHIGWQVAHMYTDGDYAIEWIEKPYAQVFD